VLSLSDYNTPEPHQNLYSTDQYDEWSRSYLADFYSSDYKQWKFQYPEMDISLKTPCIFGRVILADGKPVEGAEVILSKSEGGETTTKTSKNGYYVFNRVSRGEYTIILEKEGFENVFFSHRQNSVTINFFRDKISRDILILPRGSGNPKFIKKRETTKDKCDSYNWFEYYKNIFTVFSEPVSGDGNSIIGTVLLPDGSAIPGVLVSLSADGVSKKTVSNEEGRFWFYGLKSGIYELKFELEGFKTVFRKNIHIYGKRGISLNITMETTTIKEEIVICSKGGDESVYKNDRNRFDISKISLRTEGKPVLFVEKVETDEEGKAEITCKTSDRLSTFRIMAVAYNEDCFGSSEERILVSKKLLLEEALPEFARTEDSFRAGALVSNRSEILKEVEVLAKSKNIAIKGKNRKIFFLEKKSNELVLFDFKTQNTGDAEVRFYTHSKEQSDGFLKEFPVTGCWVWESILDFDAGKKLQKMIQIPKLGEEHTLKIKVTPTIINPALVVAKKLFFYPYECMEQRTSKVIPLLLMSEKFLKAFSDTIPQDRLQQLTKEYIAVIPQFMTENGGMAYYRGGIDSPYLTSNVLWALKLAVQKKYQVNNSILEKLNSYLQNRKSFRSGDLFFQYLLSQEKKADIKKINEYLNSRKFLSSLDKILLYKIWYNQLGQGKELKNLLSEFNNSLMVEADFAYFDAGDYKYDADLPFYSSRFLTALLLQTILEVNGSHPHAARIMNWLMEAESNQWFTTQTNLWILLAMNEYFNRIEGGVAKKVELTLSGDKKVKEFSSSNDILQVEKKLIRKQGTLGFQVTADSQVYLTTEMAYKVKNATAKSRGIVVERNVYDEMGKVTKTFEQGKIYQVEILIDAHKEVPYGVIDEPLPAGFEVIREDISTSRNIKPFNRLNQYQYRTPWYSKEHERDRLIFYTYELRGKNRVVYFVKSLYSGTFTWMPTQVQGMYHPQYFGRNSTRSIKILPKSK
jgi:uncharacterized protein YfaS (alpha-2-macroglobulin family)